MMLPLTPRSRNLWQCLVHNVSRIYESQLWNSVYGHIPFKGLNMLQKHSMVIGLPIMNEKNYNCEICVIENHKRDRFPTSSSREKESLVLIHIDICGPMQTQSIGGSLYFMTFIDDYSRKIWVYFLKNKLDTFSRFKEFKVEAKRQSGKPLKVLKFDRGGEYKSNNFKTFCQQKGIIRIRQDIIHNIIEQHKGKISRS